MIEKIRLIYLLAASHSGSTLTAMLLGAHPEICTVGEIKATSLGNIDLYRCSCREIINKCPFWHGIKQDMAIRGYDFDISKAGTDIRSGANRYVIKLLRPLHRGVLLERVRDLLLSCSPNWRNNLPIIQTRNQTLLECIAHRTRVNTIVDSSKIGIRLKYLLKNPHIDVKVIRVIRDGRAVSLTYLNPASFADAADPVLRQGGMGGNRDSEKLSMENAANDWLRSIQEADAIIKTLPRNQWTQVRYEQLCSAPEQTLKKLFSFIGVNSELIPASFRSVEHHIVGNGMRLDSTDEIILDERWKTELSDADLRTFNSIAGKTNHCLGYY